MRPRLAELVTFCDIGFDKDLWFTNAKERSFQIKYNLNEIILNLVPNCSAFYLSLGTKTIKKLSDNILLHDISSLEQVEISFFLKNPNNCNITIQVLYFSKAKINTENIKYALKNDFNILKLNRTADTQYIKILFRLENTKSTPCKISLSDLHINPIFPKKTSYDSLFKIKFNANLWYLNTDVGISKITTEDNTLDISLTHKKKPFYLSLGTKSLKRLSNNKKLYFTEDSKHITIQLNIIKNNNVKVYLQLLQFNDGKLIQSNSYELDEGSNKIDYLLKSKTNYVKPLFKIENTSNTKNHIILKKLNIFINDLHFFDKFPKLTFHSLDDLFIIYDKEVIYELNLDGTKYQFFTHFKQSIPKNKFIVFGQGALSREKEFPIFVRWKWLKDLPYHGMTVMDPTLYLSEKTTISWYMGSNDKHYLLNIQMIIEKFQTLLSIKNNNTVFYGSSGGGFFAMMMATLMKNTIAIAINPQENVLKYEEIIVRESIKASFGSYSFTQAWEKYKNRLSVTALIQTTASTPKIFYKQNKEDELHYKRHLLPFKKFIEETKQPHIKLEIYNDERGHTAIPTYEEALSEIDYAINNL